MLPVIRSGRSRRRRSAARVLLFTLAIVAAAAAAASIAPGTAAAQADKQAARSGAAASNLPPIRVSAPRKRARPPPAYRGRTAPGAPANAASARSAPAGGGGEGGTAGGGGGGPPTPLNGNAVAASATRLGLPAREVPASVEVVSRETIREQGYRTTTETAQGATGVLSGDAAGAPAGFSMRGFSFGAVNVLYNGISTGPQSFTSRWMDTAGLAQVEFLKGPSSLMTGLNAIGGSVNYVSLQPTTGPVRNEVDLSFDSLGSIRSHYGSGGTIAPGIDYRFDAIGTRLNGFIEDVFRDLTALSTQLNYRVSDSFKTFVAIEYKRDSGHAYWGTPLVPTSFAGPFSKGGVVSGFAISTFDGAIIAPVTIDSRTLKTNYNVLDNSTGAEDLWLRTGFEWTLANNVILKNQTYYYQAKRHWLDSETYAFNTATNTIDRDRFFVAHDQHLVGNNTDLVWDSRPGGMDNRFAAQLQASSNRLIFAEDLEGGFPADTVAVVNPDRGFYGPLHIDIRDKRLDTVAASFEDRLKLTPEFALIGGVRAEYLRLVSSGINFDGSIPDGQPFSKTWTPVPYRAAFTFEPIRNLVFYAMTATAYDPAVASIFSIRPGTSLELTSARLYEAGIKQLFWDNRAEWTFAAYDIVRRNVYVALTNRVATLAGEIDSKGIEFAAAVRPIDGLKLWGNVALVDARYNNFDVFTGNTPSNVAPIIINAGASYRFAYWRWPIEIGGSVRHVGRRFLFEDDATVMEAYTTADLYAFVDIHGRDLGSGLDNLRLGARVRNVTDAVYAAWSDPGYPDQVYLGAPRTYEMFASARW